MLYEIKTNMSSIKSLNKRVEVWVEVKEGIEIINGDGKKRIRRNNLTKSWGLDLLKT